MLYAIVAFDEENNTDYVPLIWLVNAMSENVLSIISSRKSTDFYWPRWTNMKKIDLAKSRWLRFSGRILSTAGSLYNILKDSKVIILIIFYKFV